MPLPLCLLPAALPPEEILCCYSRNSAATALPFLLHQDVVSPAGRAQIHHFQPDAPCGERRPDVRRREALPLAGAEQHDFRLEIKNRL